MDCGVFVCDLPVAVYPSDIMYIDYNFCPDCWRDSPFTQVLWIDTVSTGSNDLVI